MAHINIIQDTFLRRPPQGSHLRLAMGIQPRLQLLQAGNARAVHASREDPRLLLLGCMVVNHCGENGGFNGKTIGKWRYYPLVMSK